MQFFNKLAAFAAVAVATVSATNTVTFQNQDNTERTIVFTPSNGYSNVDSVKIAGMGSLTVNIPESWIGNWYSVSDGAENVPGMLGEVTFQGWDDITYFDVSAIVNPTDVNGVKKIYPASQVTASVKSLISGCDNFPCNTAYYVWDDVQTVTTKETDLICTLGGSNVTTKRDEDHHLVARKFVLGQF
ncbi:DNase1 protein [Xylariales sp. AK1849]|nr:DNase1 protein [Xylariales sp. AK1849]